MAITDKSLNFHETFAPELVYISKILELSQNEYEGKIDDISKCTGIPTGVSSGKVKPSIIYAKYMGLIEYEVSNTVYKIKSTSLGKIIYDEDPYLMEIITKNIINYNLTDEKIGAPQWCYLFKRYVGPKIINKNDLKKRMEEFFVKENIKLGPLITCYKNSLSALNLLSFNEDTIKFNTLQTSFENVYVYGYTLTKSWENLYSERKEITITEVLDEIKWGNSFGFDYDGVLDALELMEEQGIIKINRLLSPITIIKVMDSDEVKYDLYSMLI